MFLQSCCKYLHIIIRLDIQKFTNRTKTVDDMLELLQKRVINEFKYNQSAEGAIEPIKTKQYVECLKDYSDKILLVGINYDKDDKQHTCKIEKITR